MCQAFNHRLQPSHQPAHQLTCQDMKHFMVSLFYYEINCWVICSVLDEIKHQGIDDVYCLSVNDAFVMRQVYTKILLYFMCLISSISGAFIKVWKKRIKMNPIRSTLVTSRKSSYYLTELACSPEEWECHVYGNQKEVLESDHGDIVQ
jgi:hypothetical protein